MRVRIAIGLIWVGACLAVQGQALRELQQAADGGVSVYPNPAADDFVYIRLAEPLDAYTVRLHLYNIIGNELPVEAEVVNPREIRIRIKDLSAGYYLLGLREERTRFKGTYKFLKR
jgi:hypothetical protein